MCKTLPTAIAEARDKFAIACKEASTLEIVGNFAAAFNAVGVITMLREVLTNEVMDAVFMPLMNTKIGFRTDRDGRADKRGNVKLLYSREVVRECLIDAVIIGLLPTGNQFNIIAGTMYPTKEGYTALLKKHGVKYLVEIGQDRSQNPQFAELPCKVNYQWNGDKNAFTIVATVKRDDYSSNDQIRGKAERKAKKALYEYITGSDFGDADETSSRPEVVDAVVVEIKKNANAGKQIGFDESGNAQTAEPAATAQPVAAEAAPAAEPAKATINFKNPGF